MAVLQQGLPNTVAPGKRPRTTLSPSQAFRADQPCPAFGTPGGDQRDQRSLTFFVRLAATGWNLQQPLRLPMFRAGGFCSPSWGNPGLAEENLGDLAISVLRRRGHDVQLQSA